MENSTQLPEYFSNDFQEDLSDDTPVENQVQVEESQERSESNLNIGENVDNDTGNSSPIQVLPSKISKNLNANERRAVFDSLLQKSVDGKLRKGMIKEIALQFMISDRTVKRFWKRITNNDAREDILSHKRMGKCGRKRVSINFNQIREIPLTQRTNLRTLGKAMNVDKTILSRHLKIGDIRRHSNSIKPFLKEGNMKQRLHFCLSMLESGSIPHDPIFKGMYNIIHINEKWFYMTKKSEKYYLLPDEENPIRTCKSKNFITKIMFLVALARPRFDEERKELFSGKIGIFPFITKEPAKRSSVNKEADTLETKLITLMKRDVIRSYLIDRVLPAIRQNWPREDIGNPIFIQQDNARVHVKDNDEEFRQAATQDGFDIRLMCQPPNSPDLNVLDLGFFNAIQSLQHQEAPRTVDELINAVVKSFDNFSSVRSNHIFLTLQSCMTEIMKAKGSQKYKIPHMNKIMLEKDGQLPNQLKCDSMLVQEIIDYLS